MSRTVPESEPLRRLATASCPLFRAFGATVRVRWTAALVPLVAYALLSRLRTPQDAAWLAAFTAVAAFLVAWTHEMAHAWAARSVGVETREITLGPLTGVAHAAPRAPSPESEAWIALAGPLSHAVWFGLAAAPWFAFVQGIVEEGGLWVDALELFLWMNAGLLALNLLPFWPLDAGRALRGLLARRMHPHDASLLTAYAGIAGGVILVLGGVAVAVEADSRHALAALGGPVLFAVGISNLLAGRALLAEARGGEGPYGEQREVWHARLPQASWSMEDPTPAEPVGVPDRRERRALAQPQQARGRREAVRPAARPLHERIDELLDRINEVGGVEHLTESERRELSDASDRLRRGDRA